MTKKDRYGSDKKDDYGETNSTEDDRTIMSYEDIMLMVQRDTGASQRLIDGDLRQLVREGVVEDLGSGIFDITDWIKERALDSLWRYEVWWCEIGSIVDLT